MFACFNVFDGVIGWPCSEGGGDMCVWVKRDGLQARWLCLVCWVSCLTSISSGSISFMGWWYVSIRLLLLVVLVTFGDFVITLVQAYSSQTSLFPTLFQIYDCFVAVYVLGCHRELHESRETQ